MLSFLGYEFIKCKLEINPNCDLKYAEIFHVFAFYRCYIRTMRSTRDNLGRNGGPRQASYDKHKYLLLAQCKMPDLNTP